MQLSIGGYTAPCRDDILDYIRSVGRPPDRFPRAVRAELGSGARRLIEAVRLSTSKCQKWCSIKFENVNDPIFEIGVSLSKAFF
jgi:hypothetical protein